MSIPESCTVLVVGGGQAGSFAATFLTREGIDVMLLESDSTTSTTSESILPSMGHFLRFIGCYDAFNSYGFIKKASGYTDFIAAGGLNGHAWNVVRSQADELLFNHAAASRARAFDTTIIDAVQFEGGDGQPSNLGRHPGTIRFQYIVDASGRYGLLSTKDLKNRKFNQTLKNIANRGYRKGGGTYGVGTGWGWFIPLYNGTHSIANSGIKSASDWSYSASTYAFPYSRIAGDAGCFIYTFFSSGLHLAVTAGVSSTVTITASIRDIDEEGF
ncbi:hypothetical protein C7999DRAFT_43806 [Corynascus novoguineensis]|uniref:FAD-binding domain-containing protein n=1 Tax=Corynascus novoguineensis TaxID=1126955 RepID=A0AAN7CM16_9PEZI|nr:hypothetical protein C7999DRAFT_43806 [Corynascus novoguineensis]